MHHVNMNAYGESAQIYNMRSGQYLIAIMVLVPLKKTLELLHQLQKCVTPAIVPYNTTNMCSNLYMFLQEGDT